jgi:hypothetical protein
MDWWMVDGGRTEGMMGDGWWWRGGLTSKGRTVGVMRIVPGCRSRQFAQD